MTKLYFHDALTSDTGTLPTTIQSALGAATVSSDAATVNRSMDTSIGTSQTSKGLTTTTGSAHKYYFTRFVSSPMNITSLASDTWTYAFATSETSTGNEFPTTTSGGNAQQINITFYVWRPSTGAKIATILDGLSNGTYTATSSTTETAKTGTFAGASVSFASQDILCFEAYLEVVGTATGGAVSYFYDGTTEGSATTNAAFINSPSNTITFGGGGGIPTFFGLPPVTLLVPA